jgi:hypothetical protein
MPCDFPEHHGGSSGSGAAVLAVAALAVFLLIAGFLAVGRFVHAHLAAIGIDAGIFTAVMGSWIGWMAVHYRHGSAAIDQAALDRGRREAQARVTAGQRPAIEAPAPVEYHLHLHGITAEELAAAVTRHPVITLKENPWSP